MKERITVKVPAKGGGFVEFKLRAADVVDATQVMDEALFNPLALMGVKESIKYAIQVIDRIKVPLLGRILELRGVRARVELVDETNEYVFTNERDEQLRLNVALYGQLVRELLSIAPGQWHAKAWVAVKALTAS